MYILTHAAMAGWGGGGAEGLNGKKGGLSPPSSIYIRSSQLNFEHGISCTLLYDVFG